MTKDSNIKKIASPIPFSILSIFKIVTKIDCNKNELTKESASIRKNIYILAYPYVHFLNNRYYY